MIINLEQIIKEGKIEYIARKNADEEVLQNWVKTKLAEDIKESTSMGYSHTTINNRILPSPPLTYKNDNRLDFARQYIASIYPELEIKNWYSSHSHYGSRCLEYFTISW